MTIRQVIAWFMVLPCLALAASCSDDSGGCQDLSGDWKLDGTCAPSSCEVQVSASCAMTVSCKDGTSLQGTVSGSSFSLSNPSSSCSGSVSGTSGSIKCSSSAGSCSSTLECKDGACSKPAQVGGGVAISAFCSKCAECTKQSGFSEGYCDHFITSGTFDTDKCISSGSTDGLDDPSASASEIEGWSCQQFDDNE